MALTRDIRRYPWHWHDFCIVPPLLTHGVRMGMGLQGWGGRPPFKNTVSSYSKLPCLRNLP